MTVILNGLNGWEDVTKTNVVAISCGADGIRLTIRDHDTGGIRGGGFYDVKNYKLHSIEERDY